MKILNCLLFFNRLAEIVERETETYLKMDPDPFDDRHPSKNNMHAYQNKVSISEEDSCIKKYPLF